MRSKRRGAIVVLLAGLASVGVEAQAPDAAELDRLVSRTVAEKHLVGLSVGILHEGRPVLAKGYGSTSLATKAPVTNETAFAIGSVTKQFTCAAALLLAVLAMTRTLYEPKLDAPGLAQGTTSFGFAAPEPAAPEGDGWAGAASGLWSTPADLLKWDLALMDGKILSPASYRVMTTPRRLPDGRSTGYGCGQSIRDRGAALVLRHNGAVSGFVSRNTLVPSTRSAIVLLANSDFAALDGLHDAILAKLDASNAQVPAIAGAPALEAVRAFLEQLRAGSVEKRALSQEFDLFLTAEKVRAAASALSALGKPQGLELAERTERGGMEAVTVRLMLGAVAAEVQMYRSPDGKIHEFVIYRC